MRGILVNERGQRYVAEDTYSGPGRPVDPVPPGQHGLPDHRRGCPGGGDGVAVAAVDDAARRRGCATRSPNSRARSVLPPARCRQRSPRTTTARPAVRIRCCTRSRSGSNRSASPVGAIDLRESTGGFTLGRSADHAGRRGAARQRASRSPASSPPAGRTAGLAAWGYASGDLARRRQLLWPPRRTRRRQGLIPSNLVRRRQASRARHAVALSWTISARRVTAATPIWYKQVYDY